MSNVCLTFAVYHGSTLLRREALTQSIIRIGNDPRSQLRLDDPSAARMHAVLEVAPENDVTLIDLGGDAGTYVNGTRVNKCRLTKGDELRIGETRLILEQLADERNYVVTAAQPTVMSNPFLPRHHGFFSTLQRAPTANDAGVEGDVTYRMLKSGPDIDPEEVELTDVPAVEVMVLWGQNVLHVAHLQGGQGFSVGEEQSNLVSCDYFMPAEKLGTTRLPVVVSEFGATSVVIPENATGWVEMAGQAPIALREVRPLAQFCTSSPEGHRLLLKRGTKLSIEIADFVIRVAAVNAGKPAKKGLAAGVDWSVFGYFGMALGAIGSMVASLAYFMPSLADSEDSDINQDQLYLMQQYLVSIAEREKEATQTEQVADEHADDREGGTGTRAGGEEGSMGTPTSRATNRRWAVAGPKDNPDPHIARDKLLAEARTMGMIGLLNAGLAGDPNAPTAPWGRPDALGNDEVSRQGNMWGDEIGDAFGGGGFGLSGIGEGGGGRGEGIGLGTIGPLGHGIGLGDGQGIGNGHGRIMRGHNTRPPSRMRIGSTQVTGRLPPEVIQRIVRQNYGRFRMCYEQGLARNPNLEGRVQVRFVINREGSVTHVQNGGSDLPDSGVVSCVVSSYYGLSFPQPEGGIVTVTYPIMFQPG